MFRALCFLAVLAAAGLARGERYTVWEEAGWIWGRDNQVAEDWILSDFASGSQPVVDGNTAVWIDSRHYGTDIYGYSFKAAEHYGRNDAEFPMVISPVYRSEPQISYMEDQADTYWVAWRQAGGIRAVYWALESLRQPFEVLPDYSGPFSLELDVLTYDGGTLRLEAPEAEVPEPSAAALLGVAAMAGLYGWRGRRRRREDRP